jgi:hypothetical protein
MKEDRRGWGAASGGTREIAKGPNNFFRIGDWKAQCDECARIRHASEMFLRWDNCYVCQQCWEIRNPQDFVKGVPDNQAPPWTRPRPPPTFASGATGSSEEGTDQLIDAQIVGGPMAG